jgi:DeoR/GlpR family transcriptional regulator of sugar metabolism
MLNIKLKNFERLEKIIKILEEKGNVYISNLAKYFNVSEMTIYNDLKKLQNDSKIIIVKRGAVYKDHENLIGIDLPHYERLNKNKEEKEIIARKALEHINNNEAIFLDASTTIQYLAELLSKEDSLHITVLTISPIIALELSKNKNIEIICTGGRLNNMHYYFLGYLEQTIKDININKAFISCVGFSVENGFTEQLSEESKMKSALKDYCENIYVLADNSKFNKIGAYTFGPISFAKKIITDNFLDEKYIKLIKKQKVDII